MQTRRCHRQRAPGTDTQRPSQHCGIDSITVMSIETVRGGRVAAPGRLRAPTGRRAGRRLGGSAAGSGARSAAARHTAWRRTRRRARSAAPRAPCRSGTPRSPGRVQQGLSRLQGRAACTACCQPKAAFSSTHETGSELWDVHEEARRTPQGPMRPTCRAREHASCSTKSSAHR